MDERLYEMMDWAAIEGIVYSEEDHPHELLGPHMTENGLLIQTFIPTAKSVSVYLKGDKKEYPMELEDEEGFFAVLIPADSIPEYSLKVTYDNGKTEKIKDPYSFEPVLTEAETKKFNAGICYDIYEKLGAHPMTIKGTRGVLFAVWAPNAVRVSVVGDFNLWDGRRLPMRRLWDSGIFELFVPGLKENDVYKYEIKAKGGLTYLKADPYANAAEMRPNNASVVTNLKGFSWSDSEWLKDRKKKDGKKQPMSIYEIHLGSFRRPPKEELDEHYFYNYRELAPMIAEYVRDMGYTHIELMPVMEHPFDGSWGYQVTGYYAPTSRYGSPKDFMYFVNYMHEQGIGVILDWVPAHFPRDTFGLCAFDGTCLYEHLDPRQGSHPHWGTLIYNYGRPEVRNFLIANALFWAEKYHVDGIRMDAVASMLYLDYGKSDGQWVANMYGGNENLEAIEFLKHLNSIFKKKYPDVCLIAEESTAWPKITGDVKEGGLGFDYKWNMGWMNDFTGYMSLDPYFRSYHHGELTFSMIYAYSEDFILTLSHDEVVHGKASMVGKMPGNREAQFANLRVAYGFMMAHPGKKLLFMGQDFAQYDEWSEERGVEWELLEFPEHQQMQKYYRALNTFYREHPAMYQLDYDPDGFEWINCIAANENLLVFARKTKKKEETLLFVCNFAPVTREKYRIGVPYAGKYKEIFNSDQAEFGGSGVLNPRVKQSKKEEADDRPNSITINIPPLGMSVFSYIKPAVKNETEPAAEKAGKALAKAVSGKEAVKTEEKKEAVKAAAKKENRKTASKKEPAGQAAKKTRTKAEPAEGGAISKVKEAVKAVSRKKK
ncbi:MAG: 1,4-alpha-glucan branching protein GlgB [Candidatus Limivivens sp.]|nr:1,4-alpha-glucan branching protein GlgB [Candidatus Limivivens sp.]